MIKIKNSKNKTLKFFSKKTGFGLLEVLIASSILIIVIGAVSSLARSAIRNNLISLQRAQAYNLARESVEIIRANRDSKWIDNECLDEVDCSLDWNYDFRISNGIERICTVTAEDSVDCDCPETEIILDNTKFIRSFKLENIDDLNEKFNQELANLVEADSSQSFVNDQNQRLTKITITVSWNAYSKEKKVNIPFILTGWKPAD